MKHLETQHTMTEENLHHEKEKAEAFFADQTIMEKIYKEGFSKYVEKLRNIKDAFDLEKHRPPQENVSRCVCCMDERTPYGIHSAGGGILLSDKDFNAFFEASKPDAISSHEGCGAAKIYCKQKGIDPMESNQVAKNWAQKKAKEKGVEYIHLPVPKPFHFARVCYYDGTGEFNYQGVEGLPAGFVVGRKYMGQKPSVIEAKVAGDISFGDHGFGKELLNKENSFLYVAVGDSEDHTEVLKGELADLKKAAFGKAITIDGFTRP